MKINIIIFISLFCSFSLLAQVQDTIKPQQKNQKSIWDVKCASETDNQCILTIYFADKTIKGTAKISHTDKDLNNRYSLSGDAIIRFRNGSVYQKYTYKTGILLVYYSTGELAEKRISPIDSTIEYHYKYYKNGDIWMDKKGIRQKGRQNLRLGSTPKLRNGDKIYSNIGSRLVYEKIYHSNNNLQSHTFYDDTNKKFVRLFYSPNGQLDSTATYDNNRYKNGRRYQYHPNGQLKEILDYKNNERHGAFSRWAANGQQTVKTQMQNGRYHGKYESWWPDGAVKEIGYYKNGEKNGVIIRRHHDGKILEQGVYYRSSGIGLATIWDTTGHLYSNWHGGIYNRHYNIYNKSVTYEIPKYIYSIDGKGEWKNNLRDGKWTFHYTALDKKTMNALCAIQSYKNGLLHGEVVVYYPDSTIMVEAIFENGQLNKTYKEYSKDGNLWATGNFKNHKKEGVWTSYFTKVNTNTNQKHRIEHFENDESKYIIKEWNSDGFLIQERIQNDNKQETTLLTYNRDGSYTRFVVPNGWKYGHSFKYSKLKKLKQSTIYKNKNLKDYVEIQYYPNGNKSWEQTIVNRKRNGIFYSWYKNGSPKVEIPYKNGFEHGIASFWEESGKQTVKQYDKGNEVEIAPNATMKSKCECNHLAKKSRFFPSPLTDFTEYDSITIRTSDFVITKKMFESIFVQDFIQDITSHSRHENQSMGTLVIYEDLIIQTTTGLKLNLTACRNKKNQTNIPFSVLFNGNYNQAFTMLRNFDLSVIFPQNLLHLYDEDNQQSTNNASFVRVAVKRLDYDVTKNTEVEIKIEQETDSSSCFQISEIGSTGFLLKSENPQVYLSSRNIDYRQYNYQAEDKIGVFFKSGTLQIPYQNQWIQSDLENVFINGTTIYGETKLSIKDNLLIKTPEALFKYFKSKGFEIIDSSFIEKESIFLYWKYTN